MSLPGPDSGAPGPGLGIPHTVEELTLGCAWSMSEFDTHFRFVLFLFSTCLFTKVITTFNYYPGYVADMSRESFTRWPIRILTVESPTGASYEIGEQLTSISDHDFIVQSVSDTETARERVTAEHVDCVVCLHDPPTIDGIDVLTAIREVSPDIPILFATETDAEEVIQQGPTDVVKLTDGRLSPGVATNRISSIVSRERESDKYRQIFEQANDGIAIHDPNTGDILDANRRLYRLLGYDPETHDTLSLTDVVADRDQYTETAARERIQQVAEDGPQTFEWLNQTADGDTVWVEVSLKPAEIAGDERVLSFVRDITARKENERLLRDREQQLEAVFDHPSSFAVVLDSEGRVLRANETALGYVDADPTDVEGAKLWRTPWWRNNDPTADRVRQAVEAAAAGGTSRFEVEIASGPERRALDLRVEPVPSENGADEDEIESIVVAGYDITERKERERDLRDNRDTLQRLHEITATPDVLLEEQVEQLLDFGAEQFDMDIAFLARIDEDVGHFEIIDARGDHELIRAGNESTLSETYCRHTIDSETDAPLTVQNAAETMQDDPAYEKYGLGCYLGESLVVDGELYGTLCFADEGSREQSFTSEEETLLDIMSQWLEQELTQREYQRELERTQNRLTKTFERIDDAFFAVDDEWHVTYANEAGADVLRQVMDSDYDTDELVGRHLWEEVPDAVGTTFYEKYHEAMETQESVSFEAQYEPLDVWFEVQAYPDDEGLSVYFRDITDRKEREEELIKLQDLLEQMERVADVGAWEVETDTGEVFWSEHLFDLLGVDGTEEPPLDEALDVYIDEDRPIVEQAVEDAIESEESFDVEARYRRSGNAVRWLRVQGVPIVAGDDVVRIRGAAQDITTRKEYEQTLNDLLAVTRHFARASDQSELITSIIDGLESVFDHEISSVRLHDSATGALPPTQVSSSAADHVPDPPTYDDEESFVGEVFQTGEPAVVGDLTTISDHDYGPIDSAMFIPLNGHGILGVGSTSPEAFDVEDVALVELLALGAAGAFERLERESEMRQLQRIIDHVDQKVFLLDEDGSFTYTTPSLATYLGYDQAELADVQLADIVAADAVDEYEETLETVLTRDREESLTVEVDVRLANDEVRPVEVELSSVEGAGETAPIAGVVTDISELAATRSSLASERERFQELFENLPDPVVDVAFVDNDPIIQYVNPAFTEQFGYDRETAHEANLNDLIVPDAERDSPSGLDSRAMEDEVSSIAVQRETDNGRRDFLLRGIPYEQDGDTRGFAVYTDITDQKEHERYLQVLNRVLRHNLRNDMNVVLALANRLAHHVEDDDLAEHARTLHDTAQSVATLSEKAKELERVLGRRGSDPGRVDIAAHLRDIAAEQQEAYPGAHLSVEIPHELRVVGDDYIRRACEELVENAIEHNDSESPRLAIESGDVHEGADWVELRFHDNGSGIPDDEWRIISGEAEITQITHGTGLGLWLTRWIVESYGGEIYRELPEDGDGTVVVLRLRRAEPESQTRQSEQTERV
jgi:PAS domain S-box-containing protein